MKIVYECIYNDFACDVWCVIIQLYEKREENVKICMIIICMNLDLHFTLSSIYFSHIYSHFSQCQSIFISPIIMCHVSFAWIVYLSKQIPFYLSSSSSDSLKKIVVYWLLVNKFLNVDSLRLASVPVYIEAMLIKI